jgi:PAS domain S-box-containing protein
MFTKAADPPVLPRVASLLSDAELYAALQSTGEGIYTVDTNGRCTFINRAGAAMLGYPPEMVLGRDMHGLIHHRRKDGSPYPRESCPIYRAFSQGVGVQLDDEVLWRRDGTSLPVAYSSFPIICDGAVLGAVVTFADSTARKEMEDARTQLRVEQAARERAEAAEAKTRALLAEREQLLSALEAERVWLQTVIDRLPVGVILSEGKGGERITANRAAEKLFGRALDGGGVDEEYAQQICRPGGAKLDADELASQRALRGETVLGEEVVVCRSDGTTMAALVNGGPIQKSNGEILGAVVTYEDITPLKQAERLREEWTSMIAHDLRSPVQVISGYVQILERNGTFAGRTENERRAVDAIGGSAARLARMITDLLDASRIEARRLRLNLQAIDLGNWLANAVDRLVEIADRRRICLTLDAGPSRLVADPERLEQVFGNLLSNAVKYGQPDTEIHVSIDGGPEEVKIVVTNQGPGIPADELPYIFDRFKRSRQAAPVEGLGLGLYITRGLIEAHGGRIWAESIPGETTRFAFVLPIQGMPCCDDAAKP